MIRTLKVLAFLLATLPIFATEPVDWETISLIRNEALNNSSVMSILQHLTEEIGPRLTGSPNMKKANEYTKETLESWGMKATIEPWGPFGRGWSYSYVAMSMNSPSPMPLVVLPKAWTPGTNGPVVGEAFLAKIDTTDDLEALKGKLAGKIVFVDEPRAYEFTTEAPFERYSEEDLEDICHFEIESSRGFNPGKYRARMALEKKLRPFLKEEGALAAVTISSLNDGIIRVMGTSAYETDSDPGVPTVVMAAEQYNMICRKLAKEEKVELAFELKAEFHDEDPMSYNTIGELTGGDLKNEIVMTGGHMDSWHGGTGALDNGAGVAVAMEAMRILTTLKLKPRRTVQIGLWSGEEQGLLGSKAFVESHYADFKLPEGVDVTNLSRWEKARMSTPVPKPNHKNFSAYFNFDNGGGKIRGIYTQGNAGVVPIFSAWLEPLKDLGADTVTINDTGGTDHQSFDAAGLPGFQFIQDPLSYDAKNHHTNLDVYDQAPEADLKQAAAVMAVFIYEAAMRDQKLPRKAMPKGKVEPPVVTKK